MTIADFRLSLISFLTIPIIEKVKRERQTNQLEFTRAFNNLTKALKKNIPAGAISSQIMDQQLIKAGGQYHESIVGEDELNVFVGWQITRAKLITRWDDNE